MIAVEILLVLLGVSLAYAWLLYPFALRMAARAPRAPSPVESPAPASVAVVLSAYNEEDWIAARIASKFGLTNSSIIRARAGVGAPNSRIINFAMWGSNSGDSNARQNPRTCRMNRRAGSNAGAAARAVSAAAAVVSAATPGVWAAAASRLCAASGVRPALWPTLLRPALWPALLSAAAASAAF